MPDESGDVRSVKGPIPPLLRSVIAVSAGIFMGGVVTFAVEALTGLVSSSPPVDPTNPEAVRHMMASMSVVDFLPLLLAYVVGPSAGAWIAARMAPAQPLPHAGVVALLFLVGGIKNFSDIPHPAWFVALSVMAFIASPFIGVRLARR